MPDVRIDESVTPAAHRAGLVRALEQRRVDNRFHYVGDLAAARWRHLASSHSPAHDDADGLRAYDEAARAVIAALPDGPVHVVGVACGDGVKERRLLGALAATGRDTLSATPVDVSVPLVTAAAGAMASVPGVDATDAVAVDITLVDDLSPLLAPRRAGSRVVTLFGVISTLGPDALGPAVSLMDPDDLLLASANLLPDRPGSREDIMAQYDNPPTREWLATVLAEIGIDDAGPIAFRWDEAPGATVIVGEVVPHRMCVADVEGVTVGLPPGGPIRVLESFRHTADALRTLLSDMGLEVLTVAVSPSGEEGVAVARRA
jgi:hypothetical protein